MSNIKKCDLCCEVIQKGQRYFVVNGYIMCDNDIEKYQYDYHKDVCLSCYAKLDEDVVKTSQSDIISKYDNDPFKIYIACTDKEISREQAEQAIEQCTQGSISWAAYLMWRYCSSSKEWATKMGAIL